MRRMIVLLVGVLVCLACAAPAMAGGYIPYLPDKLEAVGDKAGMLGGVSGTQISSGSSSSTYRAIMHASQLTGFYNPQLIYSCSYIVNAGEDSACPTSITVKAVFSYNGTNYPVSFGGNTGSYGLGVGGFVVSDPIGVSIPAGATYYVCTYVTVASNGWPNGRAPMQSGNGEGSNGANGSDITGSCNSGSSFTSGGYMFGPHAVVGHPILRGQPVVGLIGDSRYAGSGDTLYTTQTSGYVGYAERALGNNVAWLSSTRSSDRLDLWILRNTWRDAYFPQFVTTVINELGINDVTNGDGASTIESNLQALWASMQSRGLKVCQDTLLPKTSSSDFFATAANQTPSAGDSVRIAVNAWIRANAPCVIDSDAQVEVNGSNVLAIGGGRWWVPSTSASTTGNTHANGTVDGIPATTGWAVGHVVCGANIPANDAIVAVNSASQITLQSAATGTTVGGALVYDCPSSDGTHPTASLLPALEIPIQSALTNGQIQ